MVYITGNLKMDKKMTVFVVTLRGWDDTEVVGVFSSEDKAKAFIKTLDSDDRANSDIFKFAVV